MAINPEQAAAGPSGQEVLTEATKADLTELRTNPLDDEGQIRAAVGIIRKLQMEGATQNPLVRGVLAYEFNYQGDKKPDQREISREKRERIAPEFVEEFAGSMTEGAKKIEAKPANGLARARLQSELELVRVLGFDQNSTPEFQALLVEVDKRLSPPPQTGGIGSWFKGWGRGKSSPQAARPATQAGRVEARAVDPKAQYNQALADLAEFQKTPNWREEIHADAEVRTKFIAVAASLVSAQSRLNGSDAARTLLTVDSSIRGTVLGRVLRGMSEQQGNEFQYNLALEDFANFNEKYKDKREEIDREGEAGDEYIKLAAEVIARQSILNPDHAAKTFTSVPAQRREVVLREALERLDTAKQINDFAEKLERALHKAPDEERGRIATIIFAVRGAKERAGSGRPGQPARGRVVPDSSRELPEFLRNLRAIGYNDAEPIESRTFENGFVSFSRREIFDMVPNRHDPLSFEEAVEKYGQRQRWESISSREYKPGDNEDEQTNWQRFMQRAVETLEGEDISVVALLGGWYNRAEFLLADGTVLQVIDWRQHGEGWAEQRDFDVPIVRSNSSNEVSWYIQQFSEGLAKPDEWTDEKNKVAYSFAKKLFDQGCFFGASDTRSIGIDKNGSIWLRTYNSARVILGTELRRLKELDVTYEEYRTIREWFFNPDRMDDKHHIGRGQNALNQLGEEKFKAWYGEEAFNALTKPAEPPPAAAPEPAVLAAAPAASTTEIPLPEFLRRLREEGGTPSPASAPIESGPAESSPATLEPVATPEAPVSPAPSESDQPAAQDKPQILLEEAAMITDRSAEEIERWILDGKIEAERTAGGGWVVDSRSLLEAVAEEDTAKGKTPAKEPASAPEKPASLGGALDEQLDDILEDI